MNITEASAVLIGHFIKNDSISNEQFNLFTGKGKKTNPIEIEAALSYALKELEDKGILSKYISINDKGTHIHTWVLKKPLIWNDQNIIIDGNTAIGISNSVNSFYQSIGENDSFCNPLSITNKDISILLDMVSLLAEQNTSEKEDKEKN